MLRQVIGGLVDVPTSPGGGGGVVDGQQLFDSLHVLSLDAGARQFADINGVIAGSWATDSTIVTDPTFYTDRLGDGSGSGLLNIDLFNRTLYASDGTTRMLNWSNPGEIDLFGPTSGSAWFTSDGTRSSAFVDNLGNASGDTAPNIDLLNRKLYANDGTTEVLTWSSPTVALMFGGGAATQNKIWFYGQGSLADSAEIEVNHLTNSSGDSALNLDLLNRRLYAMDGTTENMDWSFPGHVQFFRATAVQGGVSLAINNPLGTDPTDAQLQVNNITDWYNGTQNIDLFNRKLYNPDGITVAIDYGTNEQVVIGLTNPDAGVAVFNQPTGGTGGADYREIRFGAGGGNYIDIVTDAGSEAFTELEITSPRIRLLSDQLFVGSSGLPTSDPHVVKQLWNFGGTISDLTTYLAGGGRLVALSAG